jgi:hypothetical protein
MPVVVYGLATGLLAVGAGVAIPQALNQLGSFTKVISVLVTATIAIAAIFFSDSILGWLFPRLRRSRGAHHS